MSEDFLESPRFPGCPSFGYTSTPRYEVTITRTSGGREKRNRNWSRPLYRFDCTVGPRAEDDVQELLEWYHAMGGAECGFRFKDEIDFQSCRVSETPTALDQPLIATGGSPRDYQLVKDYTVGARTQRREIYKPVSGTLLLAEAGVAINSALYEVDYSTGIVSLLYTPVGALTWGGEFDVPVRFDSEFPVELISHRAESVAFALQELRL